MTLAQHIEDNRDAIYREARHYATLHKVSIEEAISEVAEAYVEGWHEEMRELEFN